MRGIPGLLALCLASNLLAAEAVPGLPSLPEDAAPILRALRLEASIRYDDEAKIRRDWGAEFDELAVVEVPSVENRYLLGTKNAERVQEIAIRGTVNLRNAVFDAEILKERDPRLGIRLHRGFARVAEAVYVDLAPRLKEGYGLRIYGHSLGAAEAAILGMMYHRDGIAVELVLASGPPKVTDAEGWAAFSGLPILRIASGLDPIPFLPSSEIFYGSDPYIQGGSLLLLLEGPYYAQADSSFFDALGRAIGDAEAIKSSFGLPSHSIKHYVALLEAKVDKAILVPQESWTEYLGGELTP